jgi:hypothetical protein
VTAQMIEFGFGRDFSVANRVERPERIAAAAGGRLRLPNDEVEKSFRFSRVADAKKRIDQQPRIAQPGEAIIPVRTTAGHLGERGRRGCHERTRRRVCEKLEGDRTSPNDFGMRPAIVVE